MQIHRKYKKSYPLLSIFFTTQNFVQKHQSKRILIIGEFIELLHPHIKNTFLFDISSYWDTRVWYSKNKRKAISEILNKENNFSKYICCLEDIWCPQFYENWYHWNGNLFFVHINCYIIFVKTIKLENFFWEIT